uniref:Uncharacterized protein n=1 Tax=Theropithecus gelada TaxID=9565 RepID=A0A8D2GHZ4_THEGE
MSVIRDLRSLARLACSQVSVFDTVFPGFFHHRQSFCKQCLQTAQDIVPQNVLWEAVSCTVEPEVQSGRGRAAVV